MMSIAQLRNKIPYFTIGLKIMNMQVTYKSMINCFESFIMIQYFDAMNILLVWRILKLVLQFLSRKMHLKSGFDLLDLAKNVYKM